MNALDELRADLEAAAAALRTRDREWQKLCRKHGGSKAAVSLAWGSDDELARSIRAVKIPREWAQVAHRRAKARLQAAIRKQEVAHV